MDCRICGENTNLLFDAQILHKYDVSYYLCNHCNFLQTEPPYRLAESYVDSINIEDTGLVYRNIHFSKMTALILRLFFQKGGKYLDYGGGYGLFCRLMRDMGFDFYRDDIYTPNIFAKGFPYDTSWEADVVTAFEVFEHLENPIGTLEKLFSLGSSILFSTELLPDPIPRPQDWPYYGLSHGQHISFWSLETLKYIADKYKLQLYSDGSGLHLLTKKRLFLYKRVFKLLRIMAKIIPSRFYSYRSKIGSDMYYTQSLRK